MKVVELGSMVSGPGAALNLSDLGASVVKVEPPTGDHSRGVGPSGSAIFINFNRGKRSLAANLNDERCLEAVRRLIAESDILIQNLRPGVAEKFGLGPADIRNEFPKLIYVSISGFGRDGPSASRPAFDIATQAESGMMSINGAPGDLPMRVGFILVDVASTYVVSMAVLAALFSRERTGEGQTIDIAMLDVAMHLQSHPWAEYFLTGVEPKQKGNTSTMAAPAGDLFKTKDGYVVVAAYLPSHWPRFCTAVDHPELLSDDRFESNQVRVKNRALLHEIVEEWFRDRTMTEVVREFTDSGIVAAAVNTFSQAIKTTDVVDGRIVRTVAKPGGGTINTIRLPIRCHDWGAGPEAAAPSVGQHSEEILKELGYPESEIGRLVDDGVLSTGPSEREKI